MLRKFAMHDPRHEPQPRLQSAGLEWHRAPVAENQSDLNAEVESVPRNLRLLFLQDPQSGRQLHRTDALRMVKRRGLAAGLSASTCNHTFRANRDLAHQIARYDVVVR